MIIASSIYLTHKYTTRISNTMAKLKLIKTQISTELNYGSGHITKRKVTKWFVRTNKYI